MKNIYFFAIILLIGLVAVSYSCSTDDGGGSTDADSDGDGDGDGDSDSDGDGDSDSDGDGDTDSGTSDTDVDSDSDSDGDTDSSTDTECGGIDEPCCDGECDDSDNVTCEDFGFGEASCFENCEPATCDYDTQEGMCMTIPGSVSICVVDSMTESDCTAGETGCETEYGETEDTYCASNPQAGTTYCVETCEPGDSGCDDSHMCYPSDNSDSGGVCVPSF